MEQLDSIIHSIDVDRRVSSLELDRELDALKIDNAPGSQGLPVLAPIQSEQYPFQVFKSGTKAYIRFGKVHVSDPWKATAAGASWFTGRADYDLGTWIDGGTVYVKFNHSYLSGGLGGTPTAGTYELGYSATPPAEGAPEKEYDVAYIAVTNAGGTVTQDRLGAMFFTDARRGHIEDYEGSVASLPDHFEIATIYEERVKVGYKSGHADYSSIGATGGYAAINDGVANNIDDHSGASLSTDNPGGHVHEDMPDAEAFSTSASGAGPHGAAGGHTHAISGTLEHSEVDNRQPWIVVATIRRK